MKQAFDTLCRELTGYGINDLNVRTRKRPIVQARKVMCIHFYKAGRLSYRAIADIVGWNGDHTIVCKTVKEHRKYEEEMAKIEADISAMHSQQMYEAEQMAYAQHYENQHGY